MTTMKKAQSLRNKNSAQQIILRGLRTLLLQNTLEHRQVAKDFVMLLKGSVL